MSTPSHVTSASQASTLVRMKAYLELTKPEISFLVTVAAVAGFLLGSPVSFSGWTLLVLIVGVAMCAGGAGSLNHYLEWERDATMKRTRDRPIPSGKIAPLQARNFGATLVVAGVGLLCPFTNPLTAVLAALTVVLYLYVYTPLKQTTTLNTLVGTIPGALPALGGYVAATNSFGTSGAIWFAMLIAWQMPHFLALAWMYRKDYERGSFAMLPVDEPSGDSTANQMIGYTLVLIALSFLLPLYAPFLGVYYLIGATGLGGYFLYTTIQFYLLRTGLQARRVLKASIYYVPAIVLFILLHWL